MMKNKRQKIATVTLLSLSVTLAGCSGADEQTPGEINNVPTTESSAESGAPASNESGSAEVELSPEEARIVSIAEDTADTAPEFLRQSNAAVVDNILDPWYSGESMGMPWVTMLALGAELDQESLDVGEDGRFSAELVDPQDGESLADISGVMRGDAIKPVDYEQTRAGDDFRSEHSGESQKWATN